MTNPNFQEAPCFLWQVSLYSRNYPLRIRYIRVNDFGSDPVYYRPSAETGPISITVEENAAIKAGYVIFGRYSQYNSETHATDYIDLTSVEFKSGSSVSATNDITFQNGIGPVTSTGATYEASNVYFKSPLVSSNDVINAGGLYYQNGGNLSVQNLTLTQSSSAGLYFDSNATGSISDSSLGVSGRLYVQGGSNINIVNSTTTLVSSSMSQVVGGSSLVVDGGKFSVSQAGEEIQGFSVKQGSTLEFKNADVDMSGVRLQTGTDSSFKDKSAAITIDNSTFKTGFIDLYGYTSGGNLFEAIVSEGGVITAGAAIPEPAAYAAIFGALAFAFSAWRKRK